jgi:hypothetical protein
VELKGGTLSEPATVSQKELGGLLLWFYLHLFLREMYYFSSRITQWKNQWRCSVVYILLRLKPGISALMGAAHAVYSDFFGNQWGMAAALNASWVVSKKI